MDTQLQTLYRQFSASPTDESWQQYAAVWLRSHDYKAEQSAKDFEKELKRKFNYRKDISYLPLSYGKFFTIGHTINPKPYHIQKYSWPKDKEVSPVGLWYEVGVCLENNFHTISAHRRWPAHLRYQIHYMIPRRENILELQPEVSLTVQGYHDGHYYDGQHHGPTRPPPPLTRVMVLKDQIQNKIAPFVLPGTLFVEDPYEDQRTAAFQ